MWRQPHTEPRCWRGDNHIRNILCLDTHCQSYVFMWRRPLTELRFHLETTTEGVTFSERRYPLTELFFSWRQTTIELCINVEITTDKAMFYRRDNHRRSYIFMRRRLLTEQNFHADDLFHIKVLSVSVSECLGCVLQVFCVTVGCALCMSMLAECPEFWVREWYIIEACKVSLCSDVSKTCIHCTDF